MKKNISLTVYPSISSIKKQGGFTLLGWILFAITGGFYAYLGMLMFPVVISNHTLGTVLSSLQAEPGITQKSKTEILSLISRRLRINDIKEIKTSDFDIIKEEGGRISIYLDYENKIEFAKDVYIVIVNNKHVELVRQ